MKYCPKIVDDIEIGVLFKNKDKEKNIYCIGSVIRDKYIYSTEDNIEYMKKLIEIVNGENTIEKIDNCMEEKFGHKVNNRKVLNVLANAGLIDNYIENKNEMESTFDEVEMLFKDIKKIHIGALFERKCLVHWDKVLITITALSVFIMIFHMVNSGQVTFSIKHLFADIEYLFAYIVISTMSIFIHEFSHAIVGYSYGLKPSELTISTYAYVSPLVYVRLPGIYFLDEKKRIMIWLSGVLSNLILISFSYIFSVYVGGNLKNIMNIIAYTNVAIVVFSMNPMIYSDGYYILTTILKKPNLRKKSGNLLYKILKKDLRVSDTIYILYFIIVVLLFLLFLMPSMYSSFSVAIYNIKMKKGVILILKPFTNVIVTILVSMTIRFFVRRRELNKNG